ncbi:hypothetical protein, partial [Burkholderia ubonensis]|uniref:hypothetical protein n=1 Tax=Burkholderia ubonensis TaxID=101571 RepID=UPI001E65AE9D
MAGFYRIAGNGRRETRVERAGVAPLRASIKAARGRGRRRPCGQIRLFEQFTSLRARSYLAGQAHQQRNTAHDAARGARRGDAGAARAARILAGCLAALAALPAWAKYDVE